MFTNVFVNPSLYRAFVGSGRWPDKTIFMLEVRHTGTDRRPNRAGLFQAEAVGLEAHVLDASKGGSRFYDFDGKSSGSPLSATSSCNTCHTEHGAVDNTFVQFYPELLRWRRPRAPSSPVSTWPRQRPRTEGRCTGLHFLCTPAVVRTGVAVPAPVRLIR